MAPDRIRTEVQLLLEGNDERNFFEAFTEHLHLPRFQIQVLDGKDRLREFLVTLAEATVSRKVRSIGIVRDADESARKAFQSVQTALRNANDAIQSSDVKFPVPDRPEQLAGERPALSVLILPGDGQQGMLETLLCRTFAGSGMDRCIDEFFRCAEESPDPHVSVGVAAKRGHIDKARARAYLATKPDPRLSVGVAAKRGYWDLDDRAFDGVRSFLTSLDPNRTRAR